MLGAIGCNWHSLELSKSSEFKIVFQNDKEMGGSVRVQKKRERQRVLYDWQRSVFLRLLADFKSLCELADTNRYFYTEQSDK